MQFEDWMKEDQKTGINGGWLYKSHGQLVDEDVVAATSAELRAPGVSSTSAFITFAICKIREHVKYVEIVFTCNSKMSDCNLPVPLSVYLWSPRTDILSKPTPFPSH